jgi:hypothetical protein
MTDLSTSTRIILNRISVAILDIMNSSTRYINDVSARAVQLLQEGRHREAICCLRKGAKFVLAQVANTTTESPSLLVPFAFEAQQQSMQGHRSFPQCLDSVNIDGDERPTYTVLIPEMHDAMSSSPENAFVVFNRAFVYYDHGVFNSSADYAKATGSLLYNMGLAFHHLGIQENNTAALKKSLYTYQMAYTVLSQKCDDSFSYLVMLALCNNMSHIHGHFFNFEEARSFWDLISEIIACVSGADSAVAVDDYDFFVFELLLFEGRNLAIECAPAA